MSFPVRPRPIGIGGCRPDGRPNVQEVMQALFNSPSRELRRHGGELSQVLRNQHQKHGISECQAEVLKVLCRNSRRYNNLDEVRCFKAICRDRNLTPNQAGRIAHIIRNAELGNGVDETRQILRILNRNDWLF